METSCFCKVVRPVVSPVVRPMGAAGPQPNVGRPWAEKGRPQHPIAGPARALHAGPCPMLTQLCMSLALSLRASGPAGVVMHTCGTAAACVGVSAHPFLQHYLKRAVVSYSVYKWSLGSHERHFHFLQQLFSGVRIWCPWNPGGPHHHPEVSANGTYCQA